MKTYVLLLCMLIIAGCDRAAVSPQAAKAPVQWRVSPDEHTLRVRVDAMRDRAWVLGTDRIDVHDRQTGQLIRSIALPGWSVAHFTCEPDIAFDRSGNAFISHNGEPKLWEIAADTFELTQHAIRLVGREHLDIGFGRLRFAPDGTLFGVSSSGGSLWRIDVRDATAREITVDRQVLDECPWPL